MRTFGTNTINALQNARSLGLVVRDFVYITARRRDNPAEKESIGLWNGRHPIKVPIQPVDDDELVEREYLGLELLSVPPIPGN